MKQETTGPEARSVARNGREKQHVPQLSEAEILCLRQLMADARKVFGNCPLAQRALQIP